MNEWTLFGAVEHNRGRRRAVCCFCCCSILFLATHSFAVLGYALFLSFQRWEGMIKQQKKARNTKCKEEKSEKKVVVS
jgi:hypothetical protein